MGLVTSQLYIREAEAIIGTKDTSGSNAPKTPAETRTFRTRIAFEIEKDQTGEANKSNVSLYNLSQDSRNFLEQKGLVIFLKAGYSGTISNIFFGDVTRVSSTRSGPDIITKLECGDQEQLLATANVQIGFSPGSNNLQAFDAAANAMKLIIPPSQRQQITVQTFLKGFSYSGTAQELLEKLTKTIGFKFSIQDGELQILPNQGDDGQTAVEVTPDTGLIGFPTKTPEGLQFVSLLNPALRPGRLVQLQSKQFQAVEGGKAGTAASQSVENSGQIIICRKAIFRGDTSEGAWETRVEGVQKREGA